MRIKCLHRPTDKKCKKKLNKRGENAKITFCDIHIYLKVVTCINEMSLKI